MTINNKEQQEQQQRQSLHRELLNLLRISMSEQQPFARRMSREEHRAYLSATLQLALDIASGDDDDASFFESPTLVSSRTSSRYNDDNDNDEGKAEGKGKDEGKDEGKGEGKGKDRR
jgi:hypothetical protein